MKQTIRFLAGTVVFWATFATGGLIDTMDRIELTIDNISTNPSTSSTATTNGYFRGRVYAVYVDVEGGADYTTTNSTTTTVPSIEGSWFYEGTFQSSNYYVRDDGDYTVFYTNAVWYISPTLGVLTPAWTNFTLTGVYDTNSVAITGTVSLVSFITDYDFDITTTANNDRNGYIETTILSEDDVAADVTRYPRAIADTTLGVDISGMPVMLPIVREDIRLSAYDSSSTGVNVRAIIYMQK